PRRRRGDGRVRGERQLPAPAAARLVDQRDRPRGGGAPRAGRLAVATGPPGPVVQPAGRRGPPPPGRVGNPERAPVAAAGRRRLRRGGGAGAAHRPSRRRDGTAPPRAVHDGQLEGGGAIARPGRPAGVAAGVGHGRGGGRGGGT